jgi:vacuolar-type H+-ATPase subunit I/STV1
MSEIINLDNSFNNLDITKDEKNNDNENEKKIKEIIKEASEKVEWVTMDEDDINNFMDNFIEYSDDNGIEWEKFNYEVFDYNYYKSRFPKFDDEIIEILVKCSEKKIYNDIQEIKPKKREYTEDDFIVRFD